MKKQEKTGLQAIPGIGPNIEEDLHLIGIRHVNDLRGKNPQRLYDKLCEARKAHVDRCVLYVFRCAVYYAENTERDPALLKWWNWKDR